jgi:hypothetical protein
LAEHLADPAPGIERLPLWGQVLLACRLARRAVAALPADVPEDERQSLAETCDALQEGCLGGAEDDWHRTLLEELRSRSFSAPAEPVRAALEAALDAAFAAESSLDFSAAESACTGSTLRAVDSCSRSPGLTPLQARILVASDVDLLAFAANELGVGRYDPLPHDLLGRLTPVS